MATQQLAADPPAPDRPADGSSVPVLWLVRHGESTWNTLGLAQGHDDTAELTARGTRQAQRAAGQLAARLAGRPVRGLWASDLRRARQTAEIIAARLGLPVRFDTRLRERCLGVLEGTPHSALRPSAHGLSGDRVTDADRRPPGGESVRDLYQRAAAFVTEVTSDPGGAGDVIAVAHGGVLRVLDAWLRGTDPGLMRWPALPNATIQEYRLIHAG